MTKYSIVFFIIFAGYSAGKELNFSKKKMAKLERFEEFSLLKADKIFEMKKFPAASKLYDVFIVEFQKSTATAYAIYRKARCLQLTNSRII